MKKNNYKSNLEFALFIEDLILDAETEELCEKIGGKLDEVYNRREKEVDEFYELKCDGTW